MNNEFSHLTLQELEEMWLYIDKEKYSERAKCIQNEIHIRCMGTKKGRSENEGEIKKQALQPDSDSGCDKATSKETTSSESKNMDEAINKNSSNSEYYATPGIPNSTQQRLIRELKYGWALFVVPTFIAIAAEQSANHLILLRIAAALSFTLIAASIYFKSIRKQKIILGKFVGIGVECAGGTNNGTLQAKAYIEFESDNAIYRYYGEFVQLIPSHFSIKLEVDNRKRVLGYEIIK